MSQLDDLIAQVETYRDSFRLIAQPDKDGGDTLNRTAHYWGARQILNEGLPFGFFNDLNKICVNLPEGRYRRHPDNTRWYSNPDNVTRDQMGPTEATMVLYGDTLHLKRHLNRRKLQFLFHFDSENGGADMPPLVHKFPDPPTPEELAVMIRGLGWWFLYPILVLFDLLLIIDVYNDLGEGQPILNIAVAKTYPTPLGWLAKFYLQHKSTADSEIRAYYNAANAIPPLGELMILAKEAL